MLSKNRQATFTKTNMMSARRDVVRATITNFSDAVEKSTGYVYQKIFKVMSGRRILIKEMMSKKTTGDVYYLTSLCG